MLSNRDKELAELISENIVEEQQRPQREREQEEDRENRKRITQQEIREIWGDGTGMRIMEISSFIFIIAVFTYFLTENTNIQAVVVLFIGIFLFYVMYKIVAHHVGGIIAALIILAIIIYIHYQ